MGSETRMGDPSDRVARKNSEQGARIDGHAAPTPVLFPESSDNPSREPSWQLLPLWCCYSMARLTDPARCAGCNHPARCNYEALHQCFKALGRCPVAGCAAELHPDDIRRDDVLRAAIGGLSPEIGGGVFRSCWLRGTQVKFERKRHGIANPEPMSKRQRFEQRPGDSEVAAALLGMAPHMPPPPPQVPGPMAPPPASKAPRPRPIPQILEAEGLRLQTSFNPSGYRGVSIKKNGRFQAQYWHDGGHTHLGMFDTAIDAAICYARHLKSLGPNRFTNRGFNGDEQWRGQVPLAPRTAPGSAPREACGGGGGGERAAPAPATSSAPDRSAAPTPNKGLHALASAAWPDLGDDFGDFNPTSAMHAVADMLPALRDSPTPADGPTSHAPPDPTAQHAPVPAPTAARASTPPPPEPMPCAVGPAPAEAPRASVPVHEVGEGAHGRPALEVALVLRRELP